MIIISIILAASRADSFGDIEFSKCSDTIAVNTVSPLIAAAIFSYECSSLDLIDHTDCNNCDARAHFICAVIEAKFHLKAGKVWLFADSKRSSRADIYKLMPERYLSASDDCSKWGWHVAPVAIFGTDTLVFDPSTADKPVSITEWASDLIPESYTALLVIKNSRYVSFPEDNSGNFDDSKCVWESKPGLMLEDIGCERSIRELITAAYGFYDPWVSRVAEYKLKSLIEPR